MLLSIAGLSGVRRVKVVKKLGKKYCKPVFMMDNFSLNAFTRVIAGYDEASSAKSN